RPGPLPRRRQGPGGGRAVRLDPGAGPAPSPSRVMEKGLRPGNRHQGPRDGPWRRRQLGEPSQRPREGASGPPGAFLGILAGRAGAQSDDRFRPPQRLPKGQSPTSKFRNLEVLSRRLPVKEGQAAQEPTQQAGARRATPRRTQAPRSPRDEALHWGRWWEARGGAKAAPYNDA